MNTVTLELNIQQLNTVLGGLAKLPIEVGLETFNIVQQQARQQLPAQQEGPAPSGPLASKVVN